jgi:hypothetical protein
MGNMRDCLPDRCQPLRLEHFSFQLALFSNIPDYRGKGSFPSRFKYREAESDRKYFTIFSERFK